jgi:hypothetical protein
MDEICSWRYKGLSFLDATARNPLGYDAMDPSVSGFPSSPKDRAHDCAILIADDNPHDTMLLIPVIFMTALDTIADKQAGFEAGGTDYVIKPAQIREVLARVRAHVLNRLMQRELAAQNATLHRTLREREAINEELQVWASELERHNREMARLSEMVGLLQTCATVTEFREVVGYQLPHVFEGDNGALYLFQQHQKLLVSAGAWGPSPPQAQVLVPDDCWAIRRGLAHVVQADGGGVYCPHVEARSAPYACVPLIAQGEALGVLHLRLDRAGERRASGRQSFVTTVAENLALALANVRLREALRARVDR